MRLWPAAFVFAFYMFVATVAGAGEASVARVDGEPVEAGTAIEVPSSTVKNLELYGGARVALLSGTSAIVSSVNWFPPEKPGKSIRGGRLFIRSGEAVVHMASEGTFAITASGGQTMLLWRGHARVAVKDGAMSVAVDDGAAYVGTEERWFRLDGGAAASMAKKSAPRIHKSRPPAPQVAPCADGGMGVTYTGDKVPVKVCWSGAAGATGYRVELAKDDAMSRIVETLDVNSPSTLSAAPKLAPGRYFSRVLALGPEQIMSRPSPVRSLGVVRATLPAGAMVASDGAILLPKETAVGIDAAEFLAATSGGVDANAALAGALASTPASAVAKAYGLSGYAARVVRLSDAQGADLRLLLLRRDLCARVEMTPKKPRWPDAPIDVSVTLEDASQRVDLGSEPVTVEAAVDGNVVPVQWTRTGNVFRGRIAPIDGPGPFLVRVSAKDQTGAEIGSYILDIDGRRPMADVDSALKERRRTP